MYTHTLALTSVFVNINKKWVLDCHHNHHRGHKADNDALRDISKIWICQSMLEAHMRFAFRVLPRYNSLPCVFILSNMPRKRRMAIVSALRKHFRTNRFPLSFIRTSHLPSHHSQKPLLFITPPTTTSLRLHLVIFPFSLQPYFLLVIKCFGAIIATNTIAYARREKWKFNVPHTLPMALSFHRIRIYYCCYCSPFLIYEMTDTHFILKLFICVTVQVLVV